MDAITQPCLLLVEGADERDVCTLLLKKLASDFEQKIDIQAATGGADLWAAVEDIDAVSGFSRVTRLAVLVDAEDTPVQTQSNWERQKSAFNVKYPHIEFSFLILPSATQTGALDSVFLQSLDLTSNSVAKCAADFVTCVGVDGALTTQARKDKVALISYINAQSKNPYARVGVALKQTAKELFDFSHPSFHALTAFLQKLL